MPFHEQRNPAVAFLQPPGLVWLEHGQHQNRTNECPHGCGHATQDLTGKEAGPATYLGRGTELRWGELNIRSGSPHS